MCLIIDHGIENLLMLDGLIIEADSKLEYFARFSASKVNVTQGRPHGIKYSLTLHNKHNERLMGFDNAHPIKNKQKGRYFRRRKLIMWDHKHQLGDVSTITPYNYISADKLLVDFWTAVDEAIKTGS